MRLLVVDDDALTRRSLSLQLTRAGYEVHEAEDGEEAWQRIAAEHFRFVITDWAMPGLDGMGLVQRIRREPLPGYVYVILLTGNASKPDVVRGLDAGADDYLTKPFDHDELRARVAIGVRILELEDRLNKSRDELAALAVRDGLTGLYNRRAFDSRLADEVHRAARYRRPLSLLMIDIDHFKLYNDAYGHPHGDQLLRDMAGLLQRSVRSTDFVARYGGEEFAIILPESNQANALGLASAILARVAEHPFVDDETQLVGPLTVSIGAAQHGGEAGASEALLLSADQALYRAKRAGRNQVAVAETALPAGEPAAWIDQAPSPPIP